MQPPPPLTLSARPTTTTTVKRSAAAASAAEATQARALKSSNSVHNGGKVSDDQLATHKLRQVLILLGRIETLYNNRGESRPVALASASLPGPHHHMERLRSPTVPAARQTTAAAAATAARLSRSHRHRLALKEAPSFSGCTPCIIVNLRYTLGTRRILCDVGFYQESWAGLGGPSRKLRV